MAGQGVVRYGKDKEKENHYTVGRGMPAFGLAWHGLVGVRQGRRCSENATAPKTNIYAKKAATKRDLACDTLARARTGQVAMCALLPASQRTHGTD